MIEIKGNLFDYVNKVDVICITTNGFVKKNGKAVMGKGCAKEALKIWKNIDGVLGNHILKNGNLPAPLMRVCKTNIFSFPVKPKYDIFNGENAVKHMLHAYNIDDPVPGWACLANLNIIEDSARILKKIVDRCNYNKVVLPRPGCGAGELSWFEVKPLLEKYFDDRFYSITFN